MNQQANSSALGDMIVIAGGGNAARAAALSLAAARLPVAIEPDLAANASIGAPDWQSVLALSPASRVMLEALNVWDGLDLPSGPIWDMQVFGQPEAVRHSALDDVGFLSPQLGFADPNPTATDAPLGHIVSLAALGRALAGEINQQVSLGKITILPAGLADFDGLQKQARLTDDSALRLALLVDTYRQAPLWRERQAARNLGFNYRAAALVGRVKAGRPHGGLAAQIFLPTGPLALLPLPAHDELALVWSLPQKRAHALVHLGADIVAHELAMASEGRFGALTPMGAMAAQDLHLSLAQEVTGPGLVAMGDAAHIVHPLAGQGFNLTLRDAAVLADTLYEARALGLPPDDSAMLGTYARTRQADAALIGATTHGLARLFQGPLAPIGRLGLGLVGRAAQKRPALRAAISAQANAGVAQDALPRLMRGAGFSKENEVSRGAGAGPSAAV